MNKVWFIECKIGNQYIPYQAETSRDGARSLQRYLKETKVIGVPSRIRAYKQDTNSRG
jgi:hypothetical protein